MRFGHMVYFRLKDNSDDARKKLVASCDEFLSGHDGTVFYASGTIAETQREVNDREFDVALQLVFESRLAHDQYQVAQQHEQFIAANQENWADVRVFDADLN